MSVKAIDIVQVLVDRIHRNGYEQRALEDDIYAEKEKRAAAEKERDHWRAARQDAMQAGELMKAEIETLRQQLSADAVRQELESLKAKNCELLEKLATVENAAATENETLRQKLTAAEAAVSLQRAGIERLQAFVGRVRNARDFYEWPKSWQQVEAALAELDAGTDEPATATEPATCPECERLRDELERANEHRIDLVQFADSVRRAFRVWSDEESFFHSVSHALDKLESNSSATPTGSPEPEGQQ